MREPGEDVAFAAKALLARSSDQRGVQEFDGNLALEASVAPMREPHAARAAFAEWRFERIGADLQAGKRRRRPCQRGLVLEEGVTIERACVLEQGADLGRDHGILLPQRREPPNALVGGELQRAIEQRTDNLPAVFRSE